MDPTPAPRWLDAEEQQVWRQWLAVNARLPSALNRDLQAVSDLSLSDLDVLVHLSESPEGRLRVLDLARTLTWERSRLSHHVSRMQRRGLVEREECADDGRGWFVVLTAQGRASLTAAAPGHVATVRRLVFDALTPSEVTALGQITAKLLDRLAADLS